MRPRGPSPGPRCSPEGAESVCPEPADCLRPGTCSSDLRAGGLRRRRVPQSQVFAGRSGPAHRAWTHTVRSASLGGAHSDGFRERLTGREDLQDPNIFLERKSALWTPLRPRRTLL